MHLLEELLPNTWLIGPKTADDLRGRFAKVFQASFFERHGLPFEIKEEFFSVSRANVVRGMHFQLPPHDHAKIVYCAAGRVEDVLVDLRAGPGYGKKAAVELSARRLFAIYIPSGVAHGFAAREDGSLVVYKTSAEHAPDHDAGILWSSFGHNWGVSEPIVSDRDARHPPLSAFNSPFRSP